jgi:hypothetical protein
MNTLTSGRGALWALAIMLGCLSLLGCKEETNLYEVNDLNVLPVNSEKDKPKTSAQYISILYTNLFQEAIGPNKMLEAQKAIESIGDKQIAYDILVSKYMNDDRVVLPTDSFMRADPETFVRDTYKRFLIRQPTEAELKWMINYIESRPNLTTELVYFAFATSNEHFHY